MNILLINGSPHTKGAGFTALSEMEKVFQKNGIDTELIQVGSQAIRGCMACNYCVSHSKCTIDDIVRTNGIEDPNQISIGQKLFIPRYVKTGITYV